ncbi:unnamed protein product, partial [Pocillopora meandrina]
GNDGEATVAATGAGENQACLGILPVKVQGKGSDRMVETYALLDNGSEVTLPWMNQLLLPMPISTSCIVKTEDLTWWPHLRDIDIPVLENGEVLLLIGLKENPGLFLPLECKSGGHDEPIAIRYSLG